MKKNNHYSNKLEKIANLPDNYCGTTYAAEFLGLSVGTIQTLVEKNELAAWKTEGGHRRISVQSILDYQKKHNIQTKENKNYFDLRLRVLVLDDDEMIREILRVICNSANTAVDCTTMASGMEALIDISNIQPHIFITDLNMPGIDGFELLRTLRLNPLFDEMMIIVLSALTHDEIQARGGLPIGSIFLSKPPRADWFSGFFAGVTLDRKNKS